MPRCQIFTVLPAFSSVIFSVGGDFMFDDLFQLISSSFLVGVFVPAGGWALSSLVNVVRVAFRYV